VIKVAGETWRAETRDGSSLKMDEEVQVETVRGNTLLVKPKV